MMTLVFKVVLLGDSGVGKTSVLRRLLGEQFDPTFIPTTPTSYETYKTKKIDVQGKQVQLQIWDAPGSEAFRTVSAAYLKDAKCILVFFDVTKVDSLRNVINWVSVVDCHTEDISHGISKNIIGNKIDKTRCVENKEVLHIAEKNHLKYHELSAKTTSYDGVADIFKNIVTDFVQKLPELSTSIKEPYDSHWYKNCTIL